MKTKQRVEKLEGMMELLVNKVNDSDTLIQTIIDNLSSELVDKYITAEQLKVENNYLPIIQCLEKAVNAIREAFPSIEVGFSLRDKVFEIWHDSYELRYDKEFKSCVGEILAENLYSKGHFNFWFDYNEDM